MRSEEAKRRRAGWPRLSVGETVRPKEAYAGIVPAGRIEEAAPVGQRGRDPRCRRSSVLLRRVL